MDSLTIEELDEKTPLAFLPATAEGTIAYVVVKGDSLWKIALNQYGNGTRWPEIYEMNKSLIGSNPRNLAIGQVLTIKAQ